MEPRDAQKQADSFFFKRLSSFRVANSPISYYFLFSIFSYFPPRKKLLSIPSRQSMDRLGFLKMWNIAGHSGKNDEIWIFAPYVSLYLFLWSLMNFDDFLIISDDFWRFLIIFDEFWSSLIIFEFSHQNLKLKCEHHFLSKS